MSALTDRLRVQGADMTGALERFVGDEELYGECFSMFLDDPAFTALDQALQAGNCSAAFDAAHTLKGVAGNLGLTALYNAVCAVVEPLRRGECTGLEGPYQTILNEKSALEALQ